MVECVCRILKLKERFSSIFSCIVLLSSYNGVYIKALLIIPVLFMRCGKQSLKASQVYPPKYGRAVRKLHQNHVAPWYLNQFWGSETK